jgi:glycosyltransferase involved in cell wall biosynthesis
MNQEPFFSVVIPTYNRAGLILKTLSSVLAQTYAHYEIIVIDDCSTDNTAEILEPLIREGKIRYLRHDHNYERSQARNTGMEKATGEFLTFLDSDDLMYPANLADAAQYIKDNPQTKLFHNLYQLVDEDGKILCKYDFPSLDDPLRAITAGNFLSSIGVFTQREIYKSYRFDTALTSSEDWDFWLRIVPYYRPGRINKVNSGVVHHHGRSVVRLDLSELSRRFAYLIRKIKDDPQLNLVYAKYLNRLEAGTLLYTSTVANLMCEHGEALKCLRRAARLDLRLVGSTSFVKAFGIALLRWNKGH